MLKDVIGDEGAKFFVVRIEEFVVDDAGEDVVAFGDLDELVELLQGKDRGFFNEEVDTGFEDGVGGFEVPVVGCSDAGEVEVVFEHFGDGRVTGKAVEGRNDAGGLFLVRGGS